MRYHPAVEPDLVDARGTETRPAAAEGRPPGTVDADRESVTPPGRRETPSEVPRGGSVRDVIEGPELPLRSIVSWRWALLAGLAFAGVAGAALIAAGPKQQPRDATSPTVAEPLPRDEQRQLQMPPEPEATSLVASPSAMTSAVASAAPAVASATPATAPAPTPSWAPGRDAAPFAPPVVVERSTGAAVPRVGAPPARDAAPSAAPVPVIRPKGERRGIY